jgi:hypothetical protein
LHNRRNDTTLRLLSRTYDALVAAGSPEDKARAAAEELAGYESRFTKIETDLAIVKWMLDVVIAGVASLVIKTFI